MGSIKPVETPFPLQGCCVGSVGQVGQGSPPPPLSVPPPGPDHQSLSVGASAMLLHCKLITPSQSLI
ncbi:hypothetical protein [Chryseobacterium taihuense]|uniref:hypothetical protein n=1 Tax=Chryseobacterium taihuense TaxID=1141221 RepID=UPI00115FEAA1|nr:hypothetical protein [Chryseobacterium taihuense]